MSARYCVVGSINMDLVAQVDRFPKPGETRTGSTFGTYPGGKGANQAVALARLGAGITMAGKIGDDVFGVSYQDTFDREGVNRSIVEVENGLSTGVAVIEVDESGENHIVIVPGANGKMDREYVKRNIETIGSADYVLFQLEIPLETIRQTLSLLKDRDARTILDPAPAPAEGLPSELLANVDFITPNESEAHSLTGVRVTDEGSAGRAGEALMKQGASSVIIKAGESGAYIVDKRGVRKVEGFSVEVADTTAAGDAFNAGFAFALGEGASLEEAVRHGNAVGAMACTGFGAQSAMPTTEEVETLLDR
ncbi:MAG: ribokinase [Spirochaetaceae bacterium]